MELLLDCLSVAFQIVREMYQDWWQEHERRLDALEAEED